MLATDLNRSLAARGMTAHLIRHAQCDITDPTQVARIFEQHRPSLLLNCAAHTGVDLCEDEPDRANAINGTGPGILAQYCSEYSAQLVHLSTDFVFNGQSGRPYRPDDAPDPISAYGRSKLMGEQAIQQVTPLTWLIIRTAWLFGRHGNCFPKIIIDRARSGHALRVVNDQVGCPTYAVDLAEAMINLIDHRQHGIWHITNSSPTSWFEFAKAIVSEFQIPAEVTPISTAQWVEMRPKQAKRPFYSVLDTTPLTSVIGRQMRNWRDSLHDYRNQVENC